MPRVDGVVVDTFDASGGELADPAAAPARRWIDDPVTKCLPRFVQIAIRKVIARLDFVVVARPRPSIKNRLHSLLAVSYRCSVQLSEKASAQVLKGCPSRSRFHGWPLACAPFTVRRAPSAGMSSVQTP